MTSNGLERMGVDFQAASRDFDKALNGAARDLAQDGNRDAKNFARESAGSHGKLYPKAWTVERLGAADYVFGPDASLPQGGMSFETGSRNQKPHLDGARAADLVETRAERSVTAALDPVMRILG